MKRTESSNPVEILSCFWLTPKGRKPKRIEVGMCCGWQGRRGLYRIIGMRYNKTEDRIYLIVRKELAHKIGKLQDMDAEDMIWRKPPYNVPV